MSEKEENATSPQINDPINTNDNHSSIISSLFALSEKLASSRYLTWMVIALLPTLILLIYPVNGSDYDLWWQMALGKYYITHHTLIMDHSTFSWTPTDPSWIYNTCLGSIVIYLIYNLMGGFGLWIFQWFVFLGIFLSFYLFFRLIRQRFDITNITLIASIGIVCSMSCNYYKPELFSFLIFPWTVFIFFCVKLTRRKFLLYLYPFIFALWVNLHGAFVVGLVFLAMAFTGEILNRIFFPRESFTIKELINMGAACLLSLAATLLNPYGIDYLLSIFNTEISSAHSTNYLKAYISVWPYLKNINFFFSNLGQTAWIMTTMLFFLGCLFLYELIRKKTCDFSLLIINIALYWKGMETGRASYFFPLAFFFTFFYLIHQLKLKSLSGRATILSLLVFFFFFVNIFYFTFGYGAGNKWFGTDLDSFVPVKEVEFLKKYKLEGPVFNDYLIGGYLVWALYPDYKVFIDSRGGGPFGKQVYPDYIEFGMKPVTSEAIKHFREKYPFKIAIIHYTVLPLIFAFINTGGEWRILYFEKKAAILIHKSLFPAITPKMADEIHSPSYFSNVSNPEVLLNVFNFYILMNPNYGRIIYDIYKKNVSDFYRPKTMHLLAMDNMIRQISGPNVGKQNLNLPLLPE